MQSQTKPDVHFSTLESEFRDVSRLEYRVLVLAIRKKVLNHLKSSLY